ncbi:IS66 family transposase [Lacipirellula limnantheis]|uniref:IS66 family transposase n=1 Tax=Lacipirellula limnantheis TaxID=2528024 RepID=UPI0011A9F7D2|nr:transposase [Lacipirellula limnantheis]
MADHAISLAGLGPPDSPSATTALCAFHFRAGPVYEQCGPRWLPLVRHCENGALSNGNKLIERSVRPVAIGHKNYLFMGSHNGGKAAAVLFTIMTSAKVNQVEPFAYARDLLC